MNVLKKNTANVSTIAEQIGLSQPSTSRHLRILRENLLVFSSQVGHSQMYRFGDQRIVAILDAMEAIAFKSIEDQRRIILGNTDKL